MICNPVINICTKWSFEIYTPNDNGGCSPIPKSTLGKKYCQNLMKEEKIMSHVKQDYTKIKMVVAPL
jgi:hypothetical protein